MRAWGRIDGLVNNVGFQFARRMEIMPESEIRQLIELNFVSAIFACQAAIPHLRAAGGGRIVNISSSTVRHANEFSHVGMYSASKAALEHFSRELRHELKADRIMVTVFSSGAAATGSVANFDPQALAEAMQDWLGKGPIFDGALQPPWWARRSRRASSCRRGRRWSSRRCGPTCRRRRCSNPTGSAGATDMSIGFIGLGNIGRPMARQLLKLGEEVWVHDVAAAPAAELAARGARAGAGAGDLADALPHHRICACAMSAEVSSVLHGGDGLLAHCAAGCIIAVHSTVAQAALLGWATQAAARHVHLIDAPMSGGAAGAEQGTLVYMAGGAVESSSAADQFDRRRGRRSSTQVRSGQASY